MRKVSLIALLFLLSSSTIVIAATPLPASASIDIVQTAISNVIDNSVGKLQDLAILWLSSFVLIQFLITNLGLLKSGADFEAIWGKFLGSLLWFGFCFYVVTNGSGFIKNVGNEFFTTAGNITGYPHDPR